MMLTSQDIATILNVPVQGDWSVDALSFDTRTIKKGSLFLALQGVERDGHDFVQHALDKGAVAAIVSKIPTDTTHPERLIMVDYVAKALDTLARVARDRSFAVRIGVTGSSGKTSSKEALKFLLSKHFKTHANVSSFNNHWGVPLTLAALPTDAQYGVFEMGMNHARELGKLSHLVKPCVVLITNIGDSHVGNLGSRQGIACAKAEIFEGIQPGGTAVLNRDDDFFELLRNAAIQQGAANITTFGKHVDADLRLVDCTTNAEGSHVNALYRCKPFSYDLPMPGYHWVMNSLGILAVLDALGLDVVAMAQNFEGFNIPKGRGVKHTLDWEGGTITLRDESYNGNPSSVRAALHVLGLTEPAPGGRRIAILGDMVELGENALQHHLGLRDALVLEKIDTVFTCRFLMGKLFDTLPLSMQGAHAPSAADLIPSVIASVKAGDVVMVKGSLSSAMGLIVDALLSVHDQPSPQQHVS